MTHSWLIAGAVVASLGGAGVSGAAESQPVSLRDALRLTFERSPNIGRALAEAKKRDGARREATGTFDFAAELSPAIDIQESELDSETRRQEEGRRRRRFLGAIGSRQLIDSLTDDLAKRRLRVPPCPPGFNAIRGDPALFFDPRDPNLPEGTELPPEFNSFALFCIPSQFGIDSIEGFGNFLDELLIRPGPETNIELDRFLNSIRFVGDADLIEEVRQRGIEQIEQTLRLAIDIEQTELLRFLRLGAMPREKITKTVSLDLGIAKALRTGTLLRIRYGYRATEENYRDKPLDTDFGAIQPTTFDSGVVLSFTQPLGKRRGRTAAGAAEKAALLNAEGAALQARHEMTLSALECIEAYLDVAAARESVTLLEGVVVTYDQMRSAMGALVQAGETARSEMTRLEARRADVETALSAARLRLVDARGALARVTGSTNAEAGVGPLNLDTAAQTAATVDDASLRQDALARRADVLASRRAADAAGTLAAEARADLAHKVDLTIQGGLHTRYFGPLFRVVPDERLDEPVDFGTDSPIEYFSPKGIWRSLKRRWLPEIGVKIQFEIPFKNSAARGRLIQAESSQRRGHTRARDLERVVEQRLESAFESKRRAAQELVQRTEAVKSYGESWEATRQLQTAGQIDLIDALQTETDRTQAALQLVQARRDHAAALARLRFEAGTLVNFGAGGRPLGVDLRGVLAKDDNAQPQAAGGGS